MSAAKSTCCRSSRPARAAITAPLLRSNQHWAHFPGAIREVGPRFSVVWSAPDRALALEWRHVVAKETFSHDRSGGKVGSSRIWNPGSRFHPEGIFGRATEAVLIARAG